MEEKYQNYLEFVKDARDFNNLIFSERKSRLPFIDTQTGVAQVDCSLWRSSSDRQRLANRQDGGSQWPGSTVYCYPAMRWQKRRRDYLLKDSLPSYSDHSSMTGRPVVPATSTMQMSPVSIHQQSSSQHLYSSSSTYSSQQTSLMRSQTSAPSRADSTGSHSCHTIDSDSRDLSIATSQSFDSPSRDDSPQLPMANGYHELGVAVTTIDTRQELFQQSSSNEERLFYSELTTSQQQQQQQQQQMNGNSTGNQVASKQLEDQTKAAIKLHSKMNKKKNIGQSLMKLSNSILVKSAGTGPQSNHNHHDQNENSNGTSNSHHQHVMNYNTHDSATTSATTANTETKFTSDTNKSIAPHAIISNGSSRPFVCSICDQTYKTRPGLSYHFIHTHNTILPKSLPSQRRSNKNESSGSRKRKKRDTTKATAKDATGSRLTRSQLLTNQQTTHDSKEQSQPETVPTSENKVSEGVEEKVVQDQSNLGLTSFECHEKMEDVCDLGAGAKKEENSSSNKLRPTIRSPFCDFCRGTKEKNRRTLQPEKLISCASCGSSGHLSCLEFKYKDIMTLSVSKYDWQCMNCKTCTICNNADNEAQLLCCENCDRSYHTYCLSPPLAEPPDGDWICELCMHEYHSKDSIKETI